MTTNPQSFLPQDYLRQKQEGRMLIINLFLFGAMLTGVVGAFVVTNRDENKVRTERSQIEAEYKAEELKVEQLKVLEANKKNLLERAEITAMLIERVPRSFLMAELINRMPVNVTLTGVDMQSRRVLETVKPAEQSVGAQSLAQKVGLAKADAPVASKPKPPRLEFSLTIEGLATNDTEVADYQAALRQCALLRGVDLISSVEEVGEIPMRRFKLEAEIRPEADVATMAPTKSERLTNGKKTAGATTKPAPKKGGLGALFGGLMGTPKDKNNDTSKGEGSEPVSDAQQKEPGTP